MPRSQQAALALATFLAAKPRETGAAGTSRVAAAAAEEAKGGGEGEHDPLVKAAGGAAPAGQG